MKNEPKDQESFFDEIMDRINAIQQDQMIEESRKFIEQCASRQEAEKAQQNIVDQEIFNEVKNASKDAAVKEKSPIRRLLDGEEDDNDEEEEQPVHSALFDDEPDDIEDFESAEERDEIYRDLKNIVGKMAIKSAVFFLLALISVYLFIAGYKPVLFGGSTQTVWYQIAYLALDILFIFFSAGIFLQGLASLIRGRASTDTLLALFGVSIIAVRIAGIIKPDFLPYQLNLEPMLAIGLLFNVLAKKKIAANIKKNFKLIAMDGDKLTVSVPPSCEANNDLILETGEGGEVMFAHRTGLVSHYIEHSYSDFEWDHKTHYFMFFSIILIFAGTIVLSQLKGWGAALLFPAAAFALSIPFFSRYYYAASIWQNGKKIRKNGGVLTSATSAKKLEDADLMIFSEEAFLGEDAVLLQGVKAMGELQIDELITDIAALFKYTESPLKNLFLKMIDLNTVTLPRIDDLYYHEGMGYSCLIHSKMFLVGNAALMRQFNIAFPASLLEMKLDGCKFPVFVAYHKSPAGVFITGYERNDQTMEALQIAEEERVSIGIISGDFNFGPELFAQLYPLKRPELLHFLSAKTSAACLPYLQRREKAADLIASRTGARGLMACLYGASKLLTALKINRVIRIVYTILSLALIFFIALSGYSANTALQILVFQAIWMLPVCAICTFCK